MIRSRTPLVYNSLLLRDLHLYWNTDIRTWVSRAKGRTLLCSCQKEHYASPMPTGANRCASAKESILFQASSASKSLCQRLATFNMIFLKIYKEIRYFNLI